MSAVLKFDYSMETVECAACCMPFAVPKRFITDRRNDHQTFFCPWGHRNVFTGASEAELLKAELEQERRRIEFLKREKEQVKNELHGAKIQLSKTKNQLARTKHRVGNGVCPCCNRTFVKLGQHMKTKHPDYSA